MMGRFRVDLECEEVRRLLNNGGDVPDLGIQRLSYDGKRFVSVTDLIHIVTELERLALSDQKQEAYRGLRMLFTAYVKGESAK